jgi:hypothetical protein
MQMLLIERWNENWLVLGAVGWCGWKLKSSVAASLGVGLVEI